MTIKDAEQLTGLTAKSIRYYEGKGLLHVERNRQNDYRSYTEQDITRLRFIKLLRYLGFGVEEIGGIIDADRDTLSAALAARSRQLEEQSDLCLGKQAVCNTLAKDCKRERFPSVIDEYNETISFIESDDGEVIRKLWLDAFCPNLSAVMLQSLIFAAPILWLFIHIHDQRWDTMLPNSIAAIVCTALLVLQWVNYFSHRRRHKQQVKEENRNNRLAFPFLLLALVAVLALFIGASVGIEVLLAPERWLFYQFAPAAELMMIVLLVAFVIVSLGVVARRLHIRGMAFLDEYTDLWEGAKRFKGLVGAVFLAALYCCLTSVTFVTEDEIIRRTPLQPLGAAYSYQDVERIETGFGGSVFSLFEYQRKGNFFYRIYLDGKSVVFHVPSTNDKIQRYENDSYLELEELDSALVRLGIPKTASEEHWESCDLDPQFVDRFLRIVRNTPQE